MYLDPQRRNLPLAGVRVTDFSWVIAGPHCTQWMGALGAEIIKVESARLEDRAHERGQSQEGQGRGGGFPLLNNTKLGVTLNLTRPEAQELARQLVMASDVVIENYAFGVMDRLGLSYEKLAKMKPDLILVASSGLGRTGPDRDYLAFGMPIHSFSGLTGLTGYEGGAPGWNRSTWTDPTTGVLLAFSVLAALYHRRRTGEGQTVEVAMSEGTITRIPEAIMDYTMNGRVWAPRGNFDETMCPHGCYPTDADDTWIALAVETEEQWVALCQLMGQPKLAQDPRFADVAQRQRHRHELDKVIGAWSSAQQRTDLFHRLQRAGIPAGPSYPIDGVVNDPQVQARDLFFEQRRPDRREETGLVPRLPWLVSPGPAPHYYPTPAMGEDNQYVFHEILGLSEAEIQRLVEEKVIY